MRSALLELPGIGDVSPVVVAGERSKAQPPEVVTSWGCYKRDVIFVGDRLGGDGNDHPVKAMGVDCLAVSRWQDAALVIQTMLDVT